METRFRVILRANDKKGQNTVETLSFRRAPLQAVPFYGKIKWLAQILR